MRFPKQGAIGASDSAQKPADSVRQRTARARVHPPVTYISPQDEAAIREGKPTSWQSVSDANSRGGEANRPGYSEQEKIAVEARFLTELPPHYYPGNQ